MVHIDFYLKLTAIKMYEDRFKHTASPFYIKACVS